MYNVLLSAAPCPTIDVDIMAGPVRQPIDIPSLEAFINRHVPEIKTPLSVKQVSRPDFPKSPLSPYHAPCDDDPSCSYFSSSDSVNQIQHISSVPFRLTPVIMFCARNPQVVCSPRPLTRLSASTSSSALSPRPMSPYPIPTRFAPISPSSGPPSTSCPFSMAAFSKIHPYRSSTLSLVPPCGNPPSAP